MQAQKSRRQRQREQTLEWTSTTARSTPAPCLAQHVVGQLNRSATPSESPDHEESEMAQDNLEGRKPVLYWITLVIIFAAFITIALS